MSQYPPPMPGQYPQQVFAQPPQQSYRALVITSWVLIGITCLLAFVPILGCATWIIAGPVLLTTVILAIVTLTRGGTVAGVGLLLMSIFVAPVIVIFAPIFSSALGISGM